MVQDFLRRVRPRDVGIGVELTASLGLHMYVAIGGREAIFAHPCVFVYRILSEMRRAARA